MVGRTEKWEDTCVTVDVGCFMPVSVEGLLMRSIASIFLELPLSASSSHSHAKTSHPLPGALQFMADSPSAGFQFMPAFAASSPQVLEQAKGMEGTTYIDVEPMTGRRRRSKGIKDRRTS